MGPQTDMYGLGYLSGKGTNLRGVSESLQILRCLKCGEAPSTRVYEGGYFNSPIDSIGSAVLPSPLLPPQGRSPHMLHARSHSPLQAAQYSHSEK